MSLARLSVLIGPGTKFARLRLVMSGGNFEARERLVTGQVAWLEPTGVLMPHAGAYSQGYEHL